MYQFNEKPQFFVIYSAEDEMFVGKVDLLSSVSHMADTPSEALDGIQALFQECLELIPDQMDVAL